MSCLSTNHYADWILLFKRAKFASLNVQRQGYLEKCVESFATLSYSIISDFQKQLFISTARGKIKIMYLGQHSLQESHSHRVTAHFSRIFLQFTDYLNCNHILVSAANACSISRIFVFSKLGVQRNLKLGVKHRKSNQG